MLTINLYSINRKTRTGRRDSERSKWREGVVGRGKKDRINTINAMFQKPEEFLLEDENYEHDNRITNSNVIACCKVMMNGVAAVE